MIFNLGEVIGVLEEIVAQWDGAAERVIRGTKLVCPQFVPTSFPETTKTEDNHLNIFTILGGRYRD